MEQSPTSPTRATVSADDTFYIESVPTYRRDLGTDHNDTIGDEFFNTANLDYPPPIHQESTEEGTSIASTKQGSSVAPVSAPVRLSGLGGSSQSSSTSSKSHVSSVVPPTRVSNTAQAPPKRATTVAPTTAKVVPPKRASNVATAKTAVPPIRFSNTVPTKRISTTADTGHSRSSSSRTSKPATATTLVQPPMRFGSTSQKPVPTASTTRNVPPKRISTAVSEGGHTRTNESILKQPPKTIVQPQMRFGSQKPVPVPVATPTRNVPPKRLSSNTADAERSSLAKLVQPPMRFGAVTRSSSGPVANTLSTPPARKSVTEVQSISASSASASHSGPMTRQMAKLNLKAATSGIRVPAPSFDKPR